MDDNKTDWLASRHGKRLGNILEEMLLCSAEEVDTIIQMVSLHGIEVVEETRDYVNNSVDIWSFGAFVVGTQRRVIERLRDRISTEMLADLVEIVLDEETFGRINFYNECDVAVGNIFADMCANGVIEERIGELISYDVDFYGGQQDDDVDLDNLMEGLIVMMEGHGIRGDVRAKAKEFLAAVAMNALDEVIDDG
jgi:hypothetical protein